MYGWRVRIGHVAPSRGDTLVYEFYQMLPAGFMMLNSTGTIRQLVDADLAAVAAHRRSGGGSGRQQARFGHHRRLARSKLGYGSDIEMGKRLSDKYDVPVSPGITGEIKALKSLGIEKLVVATPHEDMLNERMKAFLEASGFKVLKIKGYGVRKNADITDMDEHAAYKIAKRLYESAPEADGVFVPPTLADHHRRGLQREKSAPVITSSAYITHEDGEGETRSDGLRQADGVVGQLTFRHTGTNRYPGAGGTGTRHGFRPPPE
jgi:maleate isomerase